MNDFLDLMRESSRSAPLVSDPERYTAVRVWYCKYKTVAWLNTFNNLEELSIAGLPDKSFEFPGSLRKLRSLSILNMPKIESIEPLSALGMLESLSLATSPGWNSAKKKLVVKSLLPLVSLPKLRHLELFGVVTSADALSELLKLNHLETARLSSFECNDIAEFYSRSGVENAYNPRMSFTVHDEAATNLE